MTKHPFSMNEKREYGLLEDDLNKIVSIVRSNQLVNKTILFGSRAKGSFDPGSDIDIALQGSNLKLDDILTMKVELEKLSLPYKFDIVIYERINEKDLIDHIDRVGITLFERNIPMPNTYKK